MRTRSPSLPAHGADGLALLDKISSHNKSFGEMKIGGDQALTVIDEDQATFEMQSGLGESHQSSGRSAHHSPHGRREINPKMGTLWLAIEYALAAEARRAPRALDRHDEAAPERIQIGDAVEALGLAHALRGDPGQQDGVDWRDLIGWQAVDTLNVEGSGHDRRLMAGGSVCGGHRDPHHRRRVTVEADDEPPLGRGRADDLAIDVERGVRRGSAKGVAALNELARQRQTGRCGPGRRRQTAGGEARQELAAVQAIFSCQRFSASAGVA